LCPGPGDDFSQGGHDTPEAVILRRFAAGQELFHHHFAPLVVSRNGVIERIKPEPDTDTRRVQERSAPYEEVS
jgi:hypothetical protein